MLDLREKPQTRTPPAKRWRNYYRFYQVLTLSGVGTLFPGIHPGPDAFVSKDIADEHAHAFMRIVNPPGRWFVDHVGAFPEGDRAN